MVLNKWKYIVICLSLFVIVCFLNFKYEVIAFHPFRGEGQPELTVMTWNVHCSAGTGIKRQKAISKLIIKEDADIVLLNEFNQDSCLIIDSVLRVRYPNTVEQSSHQKSGDIFYSKRPLSGSGKIITPPKIKGIKAIMATISVGCDSVKIFGVHMASNHDEGTTSYERYKIAQEKRCFQAHWTKVSVQDSKHPVIVMGDMNDFSCSAPLDSLTSCGLKDAWWEGGNGYGSTFHDGWMRLRIDHILHSEELKLESIRVIETELSDHNPVVAGFSLTK